MGESEKMFAIGPKGPVNPDPLVALGLRFYSKTGHWRRIGSFHKHLPTRVSRRLVSEEIGLPESVIEAWENAVKAGNTQGTDDVSELLRICPSGVAHSQPLQHLGFCFYPQSRVWRRARAARDEVTREQVAKRIGVTEEVLLAWELAACAGLKEDAKPANGRLPPR
jgi:hypothetical protein